jgi:hypothetical protein
MWPLFDREVLLLPLGVTALKVSTEWSDTFGFSVVIDSNNALTPVLINEEL